MGQQQLLLIILGTIIVSIAIIVGMNLFQSSAISANRDGLDSDLLHLANQAQAFHKKTTNFGGGNKSFVGFSIPPRLTSNDHGSYSILYARTDRMMMEGVGVEKVSGGVGCSEGNYVTHRILVFPDSVQIQHVY